jgi:hypothetical protein
VRREWQKMQGIKTDWIATPAASIIYHIRAVKTGVPKIRHICSFSATISQNGLPEAGVLDARAPASRSAAARSLTRWKCFSARRPVAIAAVHSREDQNSTSSSSNWRGSCLAASTHSIISGTAMIFSQ